MNPHSSSGASGDDNSHMTIARDAIQEGLRAERLFRYYNQLTQSEAPPLDGLLWSEVDRIVAQSKLSDQVLAQKLDSKAALHELIGRMELLYDTTWTEAQEKCSAAWLAEAGLPIWNQAIQALLPPTLGDLQLWARRVVPSDQRLGHQYSYRASDKPAFAEIYVYDMGHSYLLPETVDDRVLEEFARSRRDIPSEYEDENRFANDFSETEFDFIEDSESLHRQRMISRSWCTLSGTDPLDVGKVYSLCLTVFNGAFIKVILRWPLKYFLSMSDDERFTLDARMRAALGKFFRDYAR